jgi:CheY-like chemotaxis protein
MARVGLLEDNSTIARLATTMLHHVGHQVTIYEHSIECLAALSLTNAPNVVRCTREPTTNITLPVELLILDLHLPEIGGLHILKLLQEHPHTRSLPLIFCTAATEREIAIAFRLAPQARLVEKPFKMQALLSAVSHVLQVR